MSLPLIDIGSIIAIVGLAITVLKLHLDQRKSKKELELAKEYLTTLTNLVKSMASQQQLEKEKFEWNKLVTIGKALGWLYEHSEEE